MDPIFCIHIWDLEPDFKIVELKRTNEENEKDLWRCHSYNERGRPWSSWKVRKVKPEYQIYNIWYHAHRSISAGFQSEDFPRCSSAAVQLQQGPAFSSGLFQGCPEAEGEEWMSGALGDHLEEGAHRWLEGAVRHHSALSCSLLGQLWKLKWGVFLGPYFNKSLELE